MKKIYNLAGCALIVTALAVVPAVAQSTQGSSSGQSGSQGATTGSQGSTAGSTPSSGGQSETRPRSGTQSGQTTGSPAGDGSATQERDRDQKVTSYGAKVGEDVPSQGTDTDQRGRTAAEQPVKPGTGALVAADRTFLTTALEGNRAETQLAELAVQKASSPSVRQLAETLEQHHEQANEKLQAVAARVGGATNAPQLKPKHKQLHDRLSGLDGEAFDRAYATEMVKAHEKTIDMYQKASSKLQNSELKAYAAETLPTLKKHLEMARAAQGGSTRTQ